MDKSIKLFDSNGVWNNTDLPGPEGPAISLGNGVNKALREKSKLRPTKLDLRSA